jgi:hypothetical protein
VEYEIALTRRNAPLGSRYRITRYESSRTTTADIVECRRVTTLSPLALGEATGGGLSVTVVLCGIKSVGRCLDQPALCPASYAGTHRQVRPEGAGLTETLTGTPDTTGALGQGPDPSNPRKPLAPHSICM